MIRRLRLPASIISCVLLGLAVNTWAAAESKPPSGKIMKWVDEQGVTHYGDTLPPQYSGKTNSINAHGLPQTETSNPSPGNSESGKESEQAKRDRTLLAVYSSEQEIDLARDRNLQMDQVMLEGLEQRKLSALSRVQDLKKEEAGYLKRSKAMPDELRKDLKFATQDIGKIDEQISERKQHMDTMRLRFENDKKRFIELKTGVPASENTSPAR